MLLVRTEENDCKNTGQWTSVFRVFLVLCQSGILNVTGPTSS